MLSRDIGTGYLALRAVWRVFIVKTSYEQFGIRTAVGAATFIVGHQVSEGNNAKGGHAEHKPKLATRAVRHY